MEKDTTDWVKGWVERQAPNLTESAKQKAAEFGSSVFRGNMGVGEAARIGIQHVTQDILKDSGKKP
jgi:hypothetical protein